MKPTVTLEITDEFTAISFKDIGFPLNTAKLPKIDLNHQEIKDNLFQITKIVHGSSKSKDVISKQIKTELSITRKSVEIFMKDVVSRQKSDTDKKSRLVIDSQKLVETYDCPEIAT